MSRLVTKNKIQYLYSIYYIKYLEEMNLKISTNVKIYFLLPIHLKMYYNITYLPSPFRGTNKL